MRQKGFHQSRRDYLRSIGLGAMGGMCLGMSRGCTSRAGDTIGTGIPGEALFRKRETPAKVSLVKGESRREIVYQSLLNIKDDIVRAIGKKSVLIKPNMVLADRRGCETPPDAVRGVLDFLQEHTKAKIIVGESTADRKMTTMECFEGYGYFSVRDEYRVELVDLNKQPWEQRFIFGKDNTPVPIRVNSALMDPGVFLISVPRMKVHCHAYVTLSLKNVLMAAPVNDYTEPEKGWTNGDKYAMHVTPEFSLNDPLFYNMFLLSHHVFPDLAVIDGFEGMSDRGPAGGRMVDSHVAVASLDALAADVTGTMVMGLDPTIPPYLNFIGAAGLGQGDPEKIHFIGTPLDDCIYQYRACRNFEEAGKSAVTVPELFCPGKDPLIHEA
ncbi:MAG TPA: DUF362 domain-containing protein [Bacteroides sp.]|nr:DUF362 domain-containing protein [Bacteroides sp.]